MRYRPAILCSLLAHAFLGCSATVHAEFCHPAGLVEFVYRIGGEHDLNIDWVGEATTKVNVEYFNQVGFPNFLNTAELCGEYAGKSVPIRFTKFRTLKSEHVCADVIIDEERAESLTFQEK